MRVHGGQMTPEVRWSWTVWHVEQCRRLPLVVWADDESAQYGEYTSVRPLREIATRQARAIRILVEARTVLINPLDDATMIESEVEEARRAGAVS